MATRETCTKSLSGVPNDTGGVAASSAEAPAMIMTNCGMKDVDMTASAPVDETPTSPASTTSRRLHIQTFSEIFTSLTPSGGDKVISDIEVEQQHEPSCVEITDTHLNAIFSGRVKQ